MLGTLSTYYILFHLISKPDYHFHLGNKETEALRLSHLPKAK